MGIIIFTQLMRDLVISLDQLIVYLLPSASLGSQSYGTDRDQDTFLQEQSTVQDLTPVNVL